MSDDHTTTVERLRQFGEARTSTALDRRTEAQQKDADARGTFSAGARVLDLVSGQEGVIMAPLPALMNQRALLGVRLDMGGIVMRSTSQLLWRPTPPAA